MRSIDRVYGLVGGLINPNIIQRRVGGSFPY
jgi:hypothetical protein